MKSLSITIRQLMYKIPYLDGLYFLPILDVTIVSLITIVVSDGDIARPMFPVSSLALLIN
jgi:hypothetical protein